MSIILHWNKLLISSYVVLAFVMFAKKKKSTKICISTIISIK